MKLCSVTPQLLTAGVWAKMVMNYQIRDRKILSNAQVKVIFFLHICLTFQLSSVVSLCRYWVWKICTSSFLDDPLTACQQQYQERWRNPVKGRAVPLCMPDGSYSKLQCYLSTCYCVDENGIQRRGTSVNALRDGLPFCSGDPGQSTFVSHIRPFKQFLIYFSAGTAPATPAWDYKASPRLYLVKL